MEASTAHVAERILADDKHAGTAQGSLTCDAEAATLLQNLSLESETKQPGGSDTANQVDNRDGTSSASDVGASGAAPARAGTPFPHDFVVEQQHQPVYFGGYPPPPFYYGGYEGSAGDWDEYRFVNGEGIEIPGAGVYGDNNTLVYPPSYGYASHVPYAPYTPAGTPVPTMGAADGQIYGPQAFQYNGQFYQQPVPSAAPYVPCTTPPLPKPEVSTSSTDQVNVTVDASNGNSDGGTKPIYPLAAVPLNRSYGRGSTALPLESSNSNGPGAGGDAPWMDGVAATSSDAQVRPSIKNGGAVPQSTPLKPLTQGLRPPIMGMPPPRGHLPIGPGSGYVNRVYSSGRMLPQSSYRTGRGPFGNNGYEARPNGRAWNFFDKNKARGRGSGTLYSYNEGMDLLNEQNRGPRTARFRNQRLNSTSSWQVKGQNTMTNNNTEPINVVPNRDQYNRPEFLIKYNNAKFFIIKSYSEDDIHKSIKYNVWASTPNGNKKLDSAYIEAHEMSGDCPVFLFFSVNASGQFCGVAEMTGPVDFNKSVDYWQQDKWSGHFPVKWHIVKDVPNNQLRHIILENNDNKPVTNSRDTQEVIFDKGIEMLKIFKDYVSKTSILDDFIFYEGRQKAMQERRARQLSLFQHKQVTQSYNAKESSHDHQENVTLELQDGKGSDPSLDAKDAESRSRKLCELGDCGVSTNEKHSVQPHGNHGTLSNERSTSGISASAWKGVKPTTILKRESNGNATNKSSQSNGS